MAEKGINKVILVGRLGADPELRTIPDGTSLVNLRVATSESWADKNNPQGPRIEKTEWHRVSFFGRPAEIINDYMRKGSRIYIEGSLTTRKYQDKEGNDRYITDIRGRDFAFLGGRGDGDGASGGGQQQSRPAQNTNAADEGFGDMEDIPF
ncbi:MAG: single-stranded DNA-binding protein [Gammaproteobacteria bacterium]